MVDHSLEPQHLKNRGRRIKAILGYIVRIKATLGYIVNSRPTWVHKTLSQKKKKAEINQQKEVSYMHILAWLTWIVPQS